MTHIRTRSWLAFGDLRLDAGTQELHYRGVMSRLRRKSFDVLLHLARKCRSVRPGGGDPRRGLAHDDGEPDGDARAHLLPLVVPASSYVDGVQQQEGKANKTRARAA